MSANWITVQYVQVAAVHTTRLMWVNANALIKYCHLILLFSVSRS